MDDTERKIRDRIHEHDVTMMRSYLEVDVAEWLSENEVPFAYEAFTIPSIIGPGKDEWDDMVESVRAVGEGENVDFERPDGVVMDYRTIRNLWDDIYEKHRLEDEVVGVPPRESIRRFNKTLLLPDFVIYKDYETKREDGEFDWGDFDYIVEVSGLYGVGIDEEADEDDWWDWYRASAVAFKEFAYELMGLGDKVKWVIPNQCNIDGHSRTLSQGVIDDPNFTIMNTTQAGIQLDELARELGISADKASSNLSPSITPTKYKRPTDTTGEYEYGEITPVKYEFDGVDLYNVEGESDVVIAENDFIIYYGDMGEVYIQDDHVHVRESEWRGVNMILLREYVLDSLSELHDNGIIEGLRER